MPVEGRLVVPVLGTLWVFIGAANLAGLVPGMKTPTADLNTTAALALVSYAMTHVVGIAAQGPRRYLAHYAEPTWLLLPFHLIAEVTRTPENTVKSRMRYALEALREKLAALGLEPGDAAGARSATP